MPDAGRAPADLAALAARAHALRRHVVSLVGPLGQGYVQQGLGAADLFACLFFSELRYRPNDPRWPERDRFLLSTAHNSALFHAALAESGQLAPELLPTYCVDGSALEVNVSERLGPVVEATFGSLGQGLSVGLGMALAGRRHGARYRVYVVLGDGEMQEGQLWEAAMAAGSFGVDNLCLIVDRNEMQVEGHTDRVLRMEPVASKWTSFNWAVQEVDGHDLGAILAALARARATAGRPSVIVARTRVGKGVGFLEGQYGHNMKFSAEHAAAALAELDARGPAC